jgi:hypothetical protein
MSWNLFIEAADHIVVVAAAFGIAIGANALASVLRTWIEQAFRTRRLIKALEGSRPNQRPGIIIACSQLEGRPIGAPGGATDGTLLAPGHPRPPVLIPQTKRDRKRDGN